MADKVKWGVMGLGKIANKFASDLLRVEDAILQGVASRDLEKARQFGQKYQSVNHYGSYEDLANDPTIDVIYVATPHVFHFENTLLCLENGKSVLCEKPLGMNAEEVAAMIIKAKSRNLFLMEGLWTRFIPATEKLIQLLNEKIIGELISVHADFGFKGDFNLRGRVYNKSLGGGSLLDIGIYPIYLSLFTLGIPSRIQATARMMETDVDSFCAMLFDYDNSSKAVLKCTLETDTPTEAFIYGSTGSLKMHSRFHHTQRITWFQGKDAKQVFDLPYEGNGYVYEIEEANRCVQNKTAESQKLPHQMSMNLATVMDRVRKEIGLTYPGDNKVVKIK